MNRVDILDVRDSMIADNDADAAALRLELKRMKTFYLNIMSAPGAGKTSVLLRTLAALKDRYAIGVMEADIDSDVDAVRIAGAGFRSVQLHTGGMCHLDAGMSRQGLELIGAEKLDAVILENVGNLVCPAEFDTGAVMNTVILSVPEGDDKAAKYPLIFTKCDTVLVNKTDTLPVFDFDMARLERDVRALNPDAVLIPVSAKTGEGIDIWAGRLAERIGAWTEG